MPSNGKADVMKAAAASKMSVVWGTRVEGDNKPTNWNDAVGRSQTRDKSKWGREEGDPLWGLEK